MKLPLKILYLEENQKDMDGVLKVLEAAGIICHGVRVETKTDFQDAIKKDSFDLIFFHYTRDGFDGISALKISQVASPMTPFIFISDSFSEDQLLETIKNGASYYVMKENLKWLPPIVKRSLDEAAHRTQLLGAKKQLEMMAFYDILTDLPNRALLEKHLEELMFSEFPHGRNVVLFLIGIDNIREIDQALGHNKKGDLLIKKMAQRLAQATSAFVARLGGDDFGVVLPLTQTKDLSKIASDLLTGMEGPLRIDHLPVVTRVHMGIASSPEHATTPKSLIHQAYLALSAAREEKREYLVYTPECYSQSRRKLALLGRLGYAIDNSELFMVYQPQIDLKTNQMRGVEALIRWQHPHYGVLLPRHFVLLAEKTTLIHNLMLETFRIALGQYKTWQEAGFNIDMALNLSVRNLSYFDTPGHLAEIIRNMGLHPSRIELELTESALIENIASAQNTLHQLKHIGVHLCLDDFGTGYSSLGYLASLPIDRIKIDHSFVREIGRTPKVAALVRSIIAMAHTLDLQTVAEGVEDGETLEQLKEMECDAAQGHYIAQPLTVNEINLRLWRNHGTTYKDVTPSG